MLQADQQVLLCRVQDVQLVVSTGESICGCSPARVGIRCGLSEHLPKALRHIGSGLGKSCRWPALSLHGFKETLRGAENTTHRLTTAGPGMVFPTSDVESPASVASLLTAASFHVHVPPQMIRFGTQQVFPMSPPFDFCTLCVTIINLYTHAIWNRYVLTTSFHKRYLAYLNCVKSRRRRSFSPQHHQTCRAGV